MQIKLVPHRARAIEVEMITLGEKLGELCRNKVLDDYVSRRRAEVLSESRQVYVRGSAEQKVNP